MAPIFPPLFSHREFRNKGKTTDVLSFPSTVSRYLGDVVISYPVAVSQSARYGISLLDEISRLVIHGVLHLQGYEHEGVSSSVARKMREREREREREKEVMELFITGNKFNVFGGRDSQRSR